jgi:hypothetical protein
MNKEAGRHTNKQVDMQTYVQEHTQTDINSNRQMNKEAIIQTNKQADINTNRQMRFAIRF